MAIVDVIPLRHPRRWRRGNLELRSLPSHSTLHGPDRDAALEALRQWAEGQAEDAIAWYLRDKSVRRTGSRALRAAAIVLGVAGAVVPLTTAAVEGRAAGWGYALLALAAGCLAFDHYFGLSSGWMRDIAAAQSLQRSLNEFRLDWVVSTSHIDGSWPEVAGGDGRRLHLIRGLVTAVADAVQAETAQWQDRFQSSVGRLRMPAGWDTPGQGAPDTRAPAGPVPGPAAGSVAGLG